MTTRPVILVAFAGVLIAGPYSLLAKTSKIAQQQLISLTRIFNLMFDIPTFQRPSASLFIGARAR